MGQGGKGRGPCAALVARNGHVVGARLGDAGGDRTDPDFRHQLHGDAGHGIDVLQVVDELGQVLN